MSEPAFERDSSIRSRWLAWCGFVLGALLLVAAIVTLLKGDAVAFREAFDRVREAPLWAVAVIALGPVINWLLISGCLCLLLRRHGHVGWGEMNALVGSAWLINHLPMRPGLIGRVGYHKAINGIRVRDAIESTVWSISLAAVAGVIAIGLAFALPADAGGLSAGCVIGGPVIVVGLLAFGCRFAGRRRFALLLGAFVLRYADLGLWAIRYAVVFWVLGMEVGPMEIVLVTGVSQVAQLVPIAGGGLGLREWAVAITAGSLGSAFDAALASDLLNRVFETIAVIPVGVIGSVIVAKRVAAVRRERSDASSSEAIA